MAKVLDDLDVTVTLNCNAGATAFGIDVTGLGKETRQSRVARKKRQLDSISKLVRIHVAPHADFDLFVEARAKEEFACEHCGSKWTEASDAYNGGCCAKDEEANPESTNDLKLTFEEQLLLRELAKGLVEDHDATPHRVLVGRGYAQRLPDGMIKITNAGMAALEGAAA